MSDFFLTRWISKFGEWIGDLFNAAERAWDKLEPEVQGALKKGSGIIDIINTNIDKTPEFVFEIIQDRFPDITQEKLHEVLGKISGYFKIADDTEDPDLLSTIKNIQAFLATLKGNFWEAASSTMSQIIAIAFAPDQTPFAKIALLIEYVYNKYIKK